MGSDDVITPDTPETGAKQKSTLADLLTPPISQPGDPRALNIPDPTPPPSRSLTDEVADMFTHRKPSAAESTGPPQKTVEAPAPKADLVVCPKCQVKLSSLDNKMNQCFRCRTRLFEDEDLKHPRGPLTIGI